MIEHLYAELEPVIDKVASANSKKYAAYGADADDLRQECWVWVMSHIEKIDLWRDTNDYWLKQVAQALHRECSDVGQRVKAQRRGYHREDLIGDVMGLLRDTLRSIYGENVVVALREEREADEADPPEAPRPRDPHSPLDARWAYEQLANPEDRDLIDAFYRDGCRNKEMAESRGVSEQTMSDMHHRVLRRLAIQFGEPAQPPHPSGEFEGWEGRRAISSSRARLIQSGYSDGM